MVDLTGRTDKPLVIGVFTLTLSVFILDLLIPSEIAVYVLYVLPLGLTRSANIKHLTLPLAGMITGLIVFAHLVNPGTIQEVAITNRMLGIVMVWVVAFFFKGGRF